MHECSKCGKSYKSVYGLNSHSRVHKPGYVNTGYITGVGAHSVKQAAKRRAEYDKAPARCEHCDNALSYDTVKKGNKFCNRSCAAKYNNSLREYTSPLNRICKQCGGAFHGGRKRQFCTLEHKRLYQQAHPRVITESGRLGMRKGGQRSIEVQGEARRGTNERLFHKLCVAAFSNVTCNERAFNGWDADVILPDVKVAVLWNGRWHYTKITKQHSVEQVQNRDRIKIEEILKSGYLVYVVRDDGRSGKLANQQFVQGEFAKFMNWMSQYVDAGGGNAPPSI